MERIVLDWGPEAFSQLIAAAGNTSASITLKAGGVLPIQMTVTIFGRDGVELHELPLRLRLTSDCCHKPLWLTGADGTPACRECEIVQPWTATPGFIMLDSPKEQERALHALAQAGEHFWPTLDPLTLQLYAHDIVENFQEIQREIKQAHVVERLVAGIRDRNALMASMGAQTRANTVKFSKVYPSVRS